MQVVVWLGSTYYGDENASGMAARFHDPHIPCMATDTALFFVPDFANNKIRKADSAGAVTTFTGSGTQSSTDGTGTAATTSISPTARRATATPSGSPWSGCVCRSSRL